MRNYLLREDVCKECGAPFPTDSWLDCISKDEINYCYRCGGRILNPRDLVIEEIIDVKGN